VLRTLGHVCEPEAVSDVGDAVGAKDPTSQAAPVESTQSQPTLQTFETAEKSVNYNRTRQRNEAFGVSYHKTIVNSTRVQYQLIRRFIERTPNQVLDSAKAASGGLS
jgi:hypothetical protein